jgi:flavin reductase (DIM6/NTAB) family NADH-FMN oxidoreductase RutF
VYPFERFTSSAKRTLTFAQEEAERSHHSYIGTEHLLLGLLRLDGGRAQEALMSFGVGIESVRRAVATVLGRDERILIQQIIPTSRVKRVIEIAFEEARRAGSDEVDDGHLLLALVTEGEGIAAHVLLDMGVDREKVVAALGAPKPRLPGIAPERYRDVMSTFPSGVVVVTAFGEDGQPRGLTASAFSAVSLDPPLALVCVDKTSNTLPAVQHTRGFTANILATGHEDLARRMATKMTDKFDGLSWDRPETEVGGPILRDDVAAYAVCALHDTIEAGDHWILIGQVVAGDRVEGTRPMIFLDRGYS